MIEEEKERYLTIYTRVVTNPFESQWLAVSGTETHLGADIYDFFSQKGNIGETRVTPSKEKKGRGSQVRRVIPFYCVILAIYAAYECFSLFLLAIHRLVRKARFCCSVWNGISSGNDENEWNEEWNHQIQSAFAPAAPSRSQSKKIQMRKKESYSSYRYNGS